MFYALVNNHKLFLHLPKEVRIVETSDGYVLEIEIEEGQCKTVVLEYTVQQEFCYVEIKKETNCPYDFECLKKKGSYHCDTEDYIFHGAVECNRADKDCQYSYSFGKSYFCRCPMKLYLYRKKRK
jgi:hypothetical protein